MTDVNLFSIDLNLLVVVDAVFETRSATKAAARLHVTQSAVSNALRRARRLFEDPLVTRTGSGFVATPRGAALAPRIREALEKIEDVIAEGAAEDPGSSRRAFTVAGTDAVVLTLFPALTAALQARMPRATLRGATLDRFMATGGIASEGLDLLIGIPPRVPAGAHAEDLYEEEMVVLARADHPAIGRRLSRATYARLPHAELALFGEADDRVTRALATHGLERHVVVTVPHVAALPFLVAGSDRLATVMYGLAAIYAEPLSLRIMRPPVKLAPLALQMVWHERVDADPAHALLREAVREVAAARHKRRS